MKPRTSHALVQLATATITVCTPLFGPAYGQESVCTRAEEDSAKERYNQGESHKAAGEYDAASAEYRAAFELCPRPFLLFNAGQMLWLGGDKRAALDVYQQYLALEPEGSAAAIAREQFFVAAEEERVDGAPRDALILYERYLELAPEGDHADAARAHLNELREREMARLAGRGRPQAEQEAKPPPKPPVEVSEPVQPAASPDWRPGGAFVAGSALLVLGVAMHGSSSNHRRNYDERYRELCPTDCPRDTLPSEVRDMDSTARVQWRVALASYVVGGAAFSLGLVWLLIAPSDPATPVAPRVEPSAGRPMRFTPMAGPDVLGGTWQLQF